jgi:hypothetical protein
MRERYKDEQDIKSLYDTDTEIGMRLLAEVVCELGLSALTDEAIAELAKAHRQRSGNQIEGD